MIVGMVDARMDLNLQEVVERACERSCKVGIMAGALAVVKVGLVRVLFLLISELKTGAGEGELPLEGTAGGPIPPLLGAGDGLIPPPGARLSPISTKCAKNSIRLPMK
jgi:hypothetical protein